MHVDLLLQFCATIRFRQLGDSLSCVVFKNKNKKYVKKLLIITSGVKKNEKSIPNFHKSSLQHKKPRIKLRKRQNE